VSEDIRERVRVLLERIDTAAFEAGREECEHGSAKRQDRAMERCKRHKAEVLALLSAPEPPTEFARGVLAALTWYRNLPTEEERQRAADMIAGDPELQDIIARLNALVSAPEPAETGRCQGCGAEVAIDVPEHRGHTRMVDGPGGPEPDLCGPVDRRSPAPTAASEVEPAYTGDGTETLEGWVAPYSEGLWTFEEGEADPHPTMIRASLVLRGGATAAASEPADEAHCPICGHGTEPCAPDWCYRCEKPIAPTAAEPEREEWANEWKKMAEEMTYFIDIARTPTVACLRQWRWRVLESLRALATPEAEGGSP
jgi:hypothetical protein